MFNSKTEKEDLFHRIAVLEQTVIDMKTWLAPKPEESIRKGRQWSLEQRAIASANMKARHAKEKPQKENT